MADRRKRDKQFIAQYPGVFVQEMFNVENHSWCPALIGEYFQSLALIASKHRELLSVIKQDRDYVEIPQLRPLRPRLRSIGDDVGDLLGCQISKEEAEEWEEALLPGVDIRKVLSLLSEPKYTPYDIFVVCNDEASHCNPWEAYWICYPVTEYTREQIKSQFALEYLRDLFWYKPMKGD